MTKATESLMPREKAFEERMYSLYSSMKARFKEKRNKRGKIIRIGRELPFDCLDFKVWAEKKLGGKAGAVQCRYCRTWLTALDVGFDHLEPVSQGGSLGLDNLDACCKTCNNLKGNLTYATFMWLFGELQLAGLPTHMTVADRKNLESRLKTGGVQYKYGRDKKKPAVTEPVTMVDDDF
jgi:5-methylcytosine-specific restriction endonuclease McrA